MENKKFIIGIVLVTLGILGGGIFLASRADSAPATKASSNVRVVVLETSHEWGTIGLHDGKVAHEFAIASDGTEPLLLSNIATSCMCTTAQLVLGDTVSPEFGMHSRSSYVMEIPPQKSAHLRVVFDPAFHGPNGVGPITRQVTVATNAADKPELTFILTALVER